MNTIKKETANSKTANPFQPTSTGGGVNDNLRITLGADASSDYSKCPKQVQLVCNYLHELGGTATMQQLNEFAVTADGNQFWGRGGNAYEQTVSKISAHYFSRMIGQEVWNRKTLEGKSEIVKIVK
tara:strand:+ start:101 stop:478 length:378 start_codon:yes stop_codon:yes gene_type:complete